MRVRVNTYYRFDPVAWDKIYPAHMGLKTGDRVKVVNLPLCPKANTMGHCHVERDGVFMGMVHCNSLER